MYACRLHLQNSQFQDRLLTENCCSVQYLIFVYHAHVWWFKLIKFTDELNDVTFFFKDEINVGTGHVKFTDLAIVKYMHLFKCLSSQSFVLEVSLLHFTFTRCFQCFLHMCELLARSTYRQNFQFIWVFWKMNMFWLQIN